MKEALRRRLLEVAGRQVHLWAGGSGPAVVLIHGSPGNAWLVAPLARRLAHNFFVYAVDTPGFGLSDAIAQRVDSVAQLADAYRELLDALGLQRVLVYGTHSGAAIGLELAHRHPDRVAGFVLEGVPAFTVEEQQPLLDPQYLLPLEPELLGGHYARAWTRFHDQFIWFPWYRRDPSHLNEAAAGAAADIHLWVEMYFQASRHDYQPAYRAVIRYGGDALAAAARVQAPGVYLAERSDMLFPHLDRLPPLRPGQQILRVASADDVPQTVETALRALPASDRVTACDAARQRAPLRFVDLPHGQVLLRVRAGHDGVPLLLLHDAPGAGRTLAALCDALAAHGPVLLPDLPGCGESDPLTPAAPRLADYADALAQVVAAAATGAVHVYGVGFGAALALELQVRHPQLVAAVTVSGLLRDTGAARAALRGRLAPPIVLGDDGSHWYRTWLMLRDSLVRWPWYERAPQALRRQPSQFDADALHLWTCDVMRHHGSYHLLIEAALAWDPAPAIAHAGGKLTVAVDPLHALHRSDVDWATVTARSLVLADTLAERARTLAALCAA